MAHTSAAIFAFTILSAGCVVSGKIQPTVDPGTTVDISLLWEEPVEPRHPRSVSWAWRSGR